MPFDRNIFLQNASNIELQHIYSYSESHHMFHAVIMGIKYKIVYMEGMIFSIEYHENYINCFKPYKENTVVSELISNIIKNLMDYHILSNKWLQGWRSDWKKNYQAIWKTNMNKHSENGYYEHKIPDNSFSYYINKGNLIMPVMKSAI